MPDRSPRSTSIVSGPFAISSTTSADKRPIIGVAGRREAIAVRCPVDPRDQIGEPDAEPRALGGDHRARVADRAGQLDADRTIVGRVGARRQSYLAVRRIAALAAGHAQARRRQAQAREADNAVGTIAHRTRRSRIAAEEIADARVEQSGRACADAADDLESAARRGLQVGIGIDVEDADAFDPIVVDPPVDRAGVETLVEIGDDDRLGVDARRPQAQIVAEDAAIAIGQVAVEPDLYQCPARNGVEPADARGAPRDRNDDLVGVDARLARQADTLDDDVVHREAVGIRLIIDRRQREGTVERRGRTQAIRRARQARWRAGAGYSPRVSALRSDWRRDRSRR